MITIEFKEDNRLSPETQTDIIRALKAADMHADWPIKLDKAWCAIEVLAEALHINLEYPDYFEENI